MSPRARHDPFAVATPLIGGQGRWQNLGLWPARSYDDACERLARRVGEAAHLGTGDQVLDVGAGAGASLDLWRAGFGADPLGLDPHPRAERPDLIAAPALTGQTLTARGPFDAIVSVDAAYHVAPLPAWLRAAHDRLKPGGRLAFTTLAAATPWSWLGALAAIPDGAIVPKAMLSSHLAAAGLADLHVEDLTHEVLGGFADHVAARGFRWRPSWVKIALTAALARFGSRSGALAYLLVSARRPGPDNYLDFRET